VRLCGRWDDPARLKPVGLEVRRERPSAALKESLKPGLPASPSLRRIVIADEPIPRSWVAANLSDTQARPSPPADLCLFNVVQRANGRLPGAISSQAAWALPVQRSREIGRTGYGGRGRGAVLTCSRSTLMAKGPRVRSNGGGGPGLGFGTGHEQHRPFHAHGLSTGTGWQDALAPLSRWLSAGWSAERH
jgi:hypothetical protein